MVAKIFEFLVGSRETAAEQILHPRVERSVGLFAWCARVQDDAFKENGHIRLRLPALRH